MLINGDSGETFNLFVKFFVQSASWFNQNLHQPEHCHFPQWALKRHRHAGGPSEAQPGNPDHGLLGIIISGKRESIESIITPVIGFAD
jgi:hypothetical protein